MTNLTLIVLEGTYAVCRLSPDASIPAWATAGPFVSITRTAEELSIVCPDRDIPSDVPTERPWRGIRLAGPLDFSLTGVIASLVQPLADAELPIFVISTFESDYVLIRSSDLGRAADILEDAGHVFAA